MIWSLVMSNDLSPAAEFWGRHVREQSESGLTVREYCSRHDLSPASLYGWRSKLRRDAQPAHTPGFTELRLAPSCAPMELRHPCGLRIVLPDNFSESALCRLLRVLADPC